MNQSEKEINHIIREFCMWIAHDEWLAQRIMYDLLSKDNFDPKMLELMKMITDLIVTEPQ